MRRIVCSSSLALTAAALLGASPAQAVTLELLSEETPQPGITFRHYHTTDPTTHTWVALVDLCAERVRVDARRASGSQQTTSSWASSRGVQLATNGDFYKTDPLRVYGNAVGDGVPWPTFRTGDDPAYASEWYYQRYGWIAFLWDGVEFTHTEWVKNNAASLGATGGWQPDVVAPPLPPGTLALVSGFPELVVEGTQITCPSPTDCFPDRGDMSERHPRTAMGLTEDRGTFILAVVDGRNPPTSVGMYGTELADLMFQLGAWEAFNLDGGGSSTMWVNGQVRNDYSDPSERPVTNHWGVFAGTAGGQALRPGHCASLEPCAVIPPEGATIDDDSPCFQLHGSPEYWREEAAGQGGHLYWTNAWQTTEPDDWAWWRFDFAEAGDYLLEYYAEAGLAVFDRAHYVVQAAGETSTLTINQAAGTGWQPLGTFSFDAGGAQWVAVYDDVADAVAADQHVVADAVRLTRVGSWCGDGSCDGGEDCTSCRDDCAGPVELPDNGLDDDCDGSIDDAAGEGGAAGSSGTGGSGGGAAGPGISDGSDEAGCGCATPGRSGSAALPGWLALAVLTASRARSGRRRSERWAAGAAVLGGAALLSLGACEGEPSVLGGTGQAGEAASGGSGGAGGQGCVTTTPAPPDDLVCADWVCQSVPAPECWDCGALPLADGTACTTTELPVGQCRAGACQPLADPGDALDAALPAGSYELALQGELEGTTLPLTIYLPAAEGLFPVVVFHHGYQLEPSSYASYGAHLASWGYVVVMPQMPSSIITPPTHRELESYLRALLDWIQASGTDTEGPLGGKADGSFIGLAGHSMGGKISMLAATDDARPLGVFGIDPVDAAGNPLGSAEDYPSVTPELMGSIAVPLGLLGETVNATCSLPLCQPCAPAEDNFQQYYQHAVSPAQQIEVLGASHMSFLDNPDCGVVCSVCPDGTDDPATTRRLTRRYLTAFFNVVLKDQEAFLTYLTGAAMAQDVADGLVTSETKNGW